MSIVFLIFKNVWKLKWDILHYWESFPEKVFKTNTLVRSYMCQASTRSDSQSYHLLTSRNTTASGRGCNTAWYNIKLSLISLIGIFPKYYLLLNTKKNDSFLKKSCKSIFCGNRRIASHEDHQEAQMNHLYIKKPRSNVLNKVSVYAETVHKNHLLLIVLI